MGLDGQRTQRTTTDAIAIATESSTSVGRCRISSQGAEMAPMDRQVLWQVGQIELERRLFTVRIGRVVRCFPTVK